MSKENYSFDDSKEIGPVPTNGDHHAHGTTDHIEYDDVFGDMEGGGPNYRNVGWLGTSVLMLKTQIGLGVLSIPSTFDTLGLIPGVILLITIATITTWSDYIVGAFKIRHRSVYGIEDVGQMLFGRAGREIFGAAFALCKNLHYLQEKKDSNPSLDFTFVSGSAMLGISIALNALSLHGICTAIFVAIAAIVTFTFSSIQTLGRISWIAWVGAICIIIAGKLILTT